MRRALPQCILDAFREKPDRQTHYPPWTLLSKRDCCRGLHSHALASFILDTHGPDTDFQLDNLARVTYSSRSWGWKGKFSWIDLDQSIALLDARRIPWDPTWNKRLFLWLGGISFNLIRLTPWEAIDDQGIFKLSRGLPWASNLRMRTYISRSWKSAQET